MLYADVAVHVPQTLDDLHFTYRVPEAMTSLVAVGARVVIPFGRHDQKKEGFILRLHHQEPEMKPVKDVLQLTDEFPLLLPELVILGQWVAQHYITTPYYALNAMIPALAKGKKMIRLRLRDAAIITPEEGALGHDAMSLLHRLQREDRIDIENLSALDGAEELLQRNLILRETIFQHRLQGKVILHYDATLKDRDAFTALAEGPLKNAPKQQAVLFDLLLNGAQTVSMLEKKHGACRSALEALVKKGWAKKTALTAEPEPFSDPVFEKKPVETLNAAQRKAIKIITAEFGEAEKKPVLLHGVTGSGKTEVYIQAIAKTLAEGHGAILLVPEIALTAQLVGRMRGAFKETIGIMHSRLSDQERFAMWERIRQKEIRLVVGVRSAVFVPMPDLGLLIMDEEHESTYKQSEPEPRYHARDVALKRAAIQDAVVVLGSATPSLASLNHAHQHRYHYVVLPERVGNRPMPRMATVDLRKVREDGHQGLFSPAMIQALQAVFEKDEQAILFLNRRGFSSFVLCQSCGEPIKCHQCDITMTYYKSRRMLRCHYCDLVSPVPGTCPHCGGTDLKYVGVGTEQVEHAFRQLFPHIACARLDHDTTRSKNAAQDILAGFAEGRYQVLIGTQMIAKGFDFSNVTFVGLVSADLSLNIADYKAAEQTFQLIIQVAGRAGRDTKPGHVLIQTYHPEHYAIQTAMTYDYEGFYAKEMAVRTQLSYPPLVQLMRIIISHPNKDTVKRSAGEVKAFLQPYLDQVTLLGPAAAPIERIRGRYRVQFILKASRSEKLESIGHALMRDFSTLRKNETLRILVDMDPENIL